jgi:hypothetical protein
MTMAENYYVCILFPIIILGILTIKCTKVIQQSIYYKDDIYTVYSLLHPASYALGTGSFPGVKRPGRGVDHPPHLVPMLKEE